MLKNLKILFILFVSLLLLSSITLATDINMNLPSEETLNSTNEVLEEETNIIDELTDNTVATEFDSALISSSSSLENEELGMTNILNIILIVIGFVLILLGIAILIRMRG